MIGRISLHPLTFEDALTNLIAVKPGAKGKKGRPTKAMAARRNAKKGAKRKR